MSKDLMNSVVHLYLSVSFLRCCQFSVPFCLFSTDVFVVLAALHPCGQDKSFFEAIQGSKQVVSSCSAHE